MSIPPIRISHWGDGETPKAQRLTLDSFSSDDDADAPAGAPPNEAAALRNLRLDLLFPERLLARLWLPDVSATSSRRRHMETLRRVIQLVELLFPRT